MTDRTRRDVPWIVPSWADPVVRVATGFLGGPTGRYAVVGARGLAGVAASVVLIGSVALALGVWQKGHCLMKGWSTPDHFWRACYSDLPVVYLSSPLADGGLPWASYAPSDQPPLSGLVMWLLATLSPRSGGDLPAQQWIFGLWAVVCLGLLVAGILAVVALQPRRPWQAAHLAASPALVLLALVSTDLLGVSLTLLALWAWQRRRPWPAGVLLGMALLVRPFPLVLLAAIVIVAWRERHRLAAAQVLVGTVLGALAVVLPLVAFEPRALTGAEQWWGQEPGFGALLVVPQLMGAPLPSGVAGWVAVAGWLVALGLGVGLSRRHAARPLDGGPSHRPALDGGRPRRGPGRGRPRRPMGVVQLGAVMLLVVVLTAPSLSVQSGLWVLPLLALSPLPWRDHLVWGFVEALHFLATWLHIAYSSDPGRGLPPAAYALVVVLRIAAWAWILWRVAERDTSALRPRHQTGQGGTGSPSSDQRQQREAEEAAASVR